MGSLLRPMDADLVSFLFESTRQYASICVNTCRYASIRVGRFLTSIFKSHSQMRLLFHGRLTLCTKKMKFQCLTSLDPYNQTEMLDLVWSGDSPGVSAGGSGAWKDLGGKAAGGGAEGGGNSTPLLPQIPAILGKFIERFSRVFSTS